MLASGAPDMECSGSSGPTPVKVSSNSLLVLAIAANAFPLEHAFAKPILTSIGTLIGRERVKSLKIGASRSCGFALLIVFVFSINVPSASAAGWSGWNYIRTVSHLGQYPPWTPAITDRGPGRLDMIYAHPDSHELYHVYKDAALGDT